jgi:hypothetical protein
MCAHTATTREYLKASYASILRPHTLVTYVRMLYMRAHTAIRVSYYCVCVWVLAVECCVCVCVFVRGGLCYDQLYI